MSSITIEDVLNGPRLPSLSAVAVQVLELTKDADFDLMRLADVIQKDQALTAKILRTVNSSYYGLAKPCPTISRALAYLGVNTVKSLVLSFNLVEMTRNIEAGFDIVAYWRRVLYSAAAARRIAMMAGSADPEEAFVIAVIQDVGMLAIRALRPSMYDQLWREIDGDHRLLSRAERRVFGFDHADVGARLAQRWRFPSHFADVIRWHHKPEPPAGVPLVRETYLGFAAGAALDDADPAAAVTEVGRLADRWFGFAARTVKELIRRVGEDAAELAGLFDVKTGRPPDINRILAQAEDSLIEHQLVVHRETEQLRSRNAELTAQVITDALTDVLNRKAFDDQLARRFEQARRFGSRLGLILLDVDAFKAFNDSHGHLVGDSVLRELAARLSGAVREVDTLCRYGGDEFAVILPGTGTRTALRIAERVLAAVGDHPFDVGAVNPEQPLMQVTICAGVAVLGEDDGRAFDSPQSLVHAADEALYEAKRAGGRCVRLRRDPGDEACAA